MGGYLFDNVEDYVEYQKYSIKLGLILIWALDAFAFYAIVFSNMADKSWAIPLNEVTFGIRLESAFGFTCLVACGTIFIILLHMYRVRHPEKFIVTTEEMEKVWSIR
jgi:hypothetical protein